MKPLPGKRGEKKSTFNYHHFDGTEMWLPSISGEWINKVLPLISLPQLGSFKCFHPSFVPLLAGNVILVPKQLSPFIAWLLRVWSMDQQDQHCPRAYVNAESQATFTLPNQKLHCNKVAESHLFIHDCVVLV